jgi:hypothetical protein
VLEKKGNLIGRKNMGLNQKQAQTGQKEIFERKLIARLAFLSEKGIESLKIEKDTLVKNLRANIRAVNTRLKATDANEKKNEELAKMKAEKTAIEEDPERITRKKMKEMPVGGKGKKTKKE